MSAKTKGRPFWENVDITGDPDQCWIWRGVVRRRYGMHSGRQASRIAYEMTVGPIPEGLQLDHLCRTTLCVNPLHLEPVTLLENMRRRAALITHCPRGHEYTPENTRRGPKGRRNCRACHLIHARAWAARRRAAAATDAAVA